MIFKELDPFSGSDRFAVAGRRAEEQMAHYFKRFFGGSEEVDVLNYLRIDLNGEVAQMDHLVLHPFGLMIVESKSVSGSVQIKDDGQWIRWFNKQPQGMRSPVTQARMQGMLLRDLLSRTVKQRGFFDAVEIDALVAISDTGTIQWPSGGPLPEVCKADQVPERITQKIAAGRAGSSAPLLGADHRRVIGEFLRSVHRPVKAAPSPDVSRAESAYVSTPESADPVAALSEPPASKELPAKVCKHCGGTELTVEHGKYGYYFVCEACQKNTAIKFVCPACRGEGRLRKQAKDFFAECKSCSASSLFHSNL